MIVRSQNQLPKCVPVYSTGVFINYPTKYRHLGQENLIRVDGASRSK